MRIWISKTMFASLAALTLSVATLGAAAPSYAVTGGGNGSQASTPFPPDGVVTMGLGAPAEQSYSAFYPSRAGSRPDSALTQLGWGQIDYRSNSHSSGTN